MGKWLCTCVVAATIPMTACSREDDPRRGGDATQAAEKREAAAGAEPASLKNHDWAGTYYHGDGLGFNLTLKLSPGEGAVFRWRGCLGLYDQDHGKGAEGDGG